MVLTVVIVNYVLRKSRSLKFAGTSTQKMTVDKVRNQEVPVKLNMKSF